MVQVENRAMSVAVAGSVVAHLVIFLLAALYTAFPIFAWEPPKKPESPQAEWVEKMTIILPEMAAETPPSEPLVTPDAEGFIPAPEVPLPPPEEEKSQPKGYIRTTQNDPESGPPARADFISDRDTTAASEHPAVPGGTDPVPTQDGREDLPGIELKDREYRDGEVKEDEALPTPEASASLPTPPVNPNPLSADPQPPEDPAEPGERNEATDPDAKGPDTETPPETPGEGVATAVAGETAAPSISIEPLEMSKDPTGEVPAPNPLEIKVGPEVLEASIPPPANFEELLGGEDIFPLPRRADEMPTPDARERIEPTVLLPAAPAEAAAPLPQIRRPEVINPADPILPVPPSTLSMPSVPLPGDPNADSPDAFQPHTRKQKMSGTISNRGPAAVNAEATAIGRYTRMVTGNIERRWNILRSQKADFVTFGNMRIRFDVNPQGRTQNVRILSNDANPIMTDFTLSAIMGAKVDPMPPEVVRELSLADGLLEITYNVIIY